MKDWQLDLMIENERNRAWEELNAPDPYDSALKDAAKEMEKAIADLNGAIENLVGASAELDETPNQPKVDSLIEALEEIGCDLRSMKEHWERGERE